MSIIVKYNSRHGFANAIHTLLDINAKALKERPKNRKKILQSILDVFTLCTKNYRAMNIYTSYETKIVLLMKVQFFISIYGERYKLVNGFLGYLNAKLKGIDITASQRYDKFIVITYNNYIKSKKISKLKKHIVKKVFNTLYWYILRMF